MVARETIGGYPILDEIGSGGFGAVYRARDPLNDRDVALKVLTRSTSSNTLERFRREARLAYEIDHPNVIGILHYGEDGGDRFIVMELMPINLREILRNGRLSMSTSLDVCRQAALGLRAAHERNVIHRDIKPENILADSNRAVKVSDFGIAHAADLPNLTATGVVGFGTRGYMSPEQFRDAKRVDARSDIYSLGVVLHEMLTGEAPAPFFMYDKAPVKQIRPSVPTGLERIVEKCTKLEPSRRYRTMDELLHEIADPALINRCALIDFYEATSGPNWINNENWLTDAPLNEWYGINGGGLTGLRGEIERGWTPSFGRTPTKLVYDLRLSENNLGGNVPPEIGKLTELIGLDISANPDVVGRMPLELWTLSKLMFLDVNTTSVSGTLPPDIVNLKDLSELNVSGTRLGGELPNELGGLPLSKIDLSHCHFTGSIPRNLPTTWWPGGAASMYLSGNDWTGCIPKRLVGVIKDRNSIRLPVCDD